jgi:hypothetical protein
MTDAAQRMTVDDVGRLLPTATPHRTGGTHRLADAVEDDEAARADVVSDRSRSAGRPQNVQGLVFESVTGTSVASYEPGRRKRYGLFFQGVSEQPPGRGVEDPLSLGTSGR